MTKLRTILLFLLLLLSTAVRGVEWKTWRYGDIRVWSAPKDTAYADLIVKQLHQRINAFQMELGVYPIKPLVIKILPSRKDYRMITAGKGKLVESSEAFYSPSEKIIYVRSPEQITSELYDNVLMHEYIHWFLDEVMDNVPLWFHEGMALYYSGQFGFQSYYEFTRYRFLGYRLSLNEMTYHYPANRSYWNMFYLTSVFAVNHLQSAEHTNWQKFWDAVGFSYNRLTPGSRKQVDFISAFNYSFQRSLYAFSKDFDKTLKRYGWQFPLIGINAVLFSLVPFILLIAWFRHRRKMRALPDLDLLTTETEMQETEESSDPEEAQALPPQKEEM